MCLRKGTRGVGRTTQTEGVESSALMELTRRERGWVEHILLEAWMTCPRPELSATTQKDCIMGFSAIDEWGDSALILSSSLSPTLKVKGIL